MTQQRVWNFMMKSDQKVHKTWNDELIVGMVKQRDIPAIASSPPESETQIFDTLDKERIKFTDLIKMPIKKFMRKENLFFVNRHDNIPFEVVLKRTGEIVNPQKTIQQVGIQEGDVIQLHVKQGGEEKITLHKQRILLKEYKDVINLEEKYNGMIDVRVSNDYRKYTILVKGVETIVGTTRGNIIKTDHHVFTIDLPRDYPLRAPIIKFKKPIFHPNWSIDGKVDYEVLWRFGDKRLSKMIINIIDMMTFDIVDTHNPSNLDAYEWYKRNKENIKDIISKNRLLSSHEEEKLEFYE